MKKIGMRTIKTGIGVFLSLLAYPFVVQNPLYTAIACFMSIQTSVKGSIVAGLSRIKGTILGGIIGFIFTAYLMPNNPIICAIGVVVTIYLCTLLNMKEEIAIACVTFLAINIGTVDSNIIYYSISRVIDTSVGVIIGLSVNYLLARPNHSKDVIKMLYTIEEYINKFIEYKILKKKVDFNIDALEDMIQLLEKTHVELVSSEDYDDSVSEKEEKIKVIEKLIILSRELYFHVQSIELLERRLFLNKYNYNNLIEIYGEINAKWEIDEHKSPVFNYHLNKILNQNSKLKCELEKIIIDED